VAKKKASPRKRPARKPKAKAKKPAPFEGRTRDRGPMIAPPDPDDD
jgi:hypothetical protein